MASEVFNLYLLLTLKDFASGGLNSFEAKLRGVGKEGAVALRSFQALREDLKKDLMTAGIGVGTLMMMRQGVKVAGDFEQAMTDLKLSIAEVDPNTGVENLSKLNDQMARSQALAVRLGNTLPGSTQDFLEMMTVLKQGGMQTERVLGGGGEAVAHLAVVTHQNPAELAKEYAQFGEMFQLNTQEEWSKSADLFARIFRATGVQSGEMVQGLKFAQIRAGANIGMHGLEGASQLGRILGTLRTSGLEGGFGGRELSRFLMQLANYQKMAAKLKKTDGIDLHARGIDMDFFEGGGKGKFKGFDNVFKQMEKLRALGEGERVTVGTKLFTAEGVAIATAFMNAGEEGWKKINDRVDAVLPLEQQIVQVTDTWNTKLENVQGTMSNVTATGFSPLNQQMKPLLDNTNTLLGYTQTFLQGHPQIVQIGTDFVVIGGVVLTVTGGVRALLVAINLMRIASALAAGESIASAGKVTMSLAGVRGMLSSLSTPVKIAIVATEILWVIGEIRELKELIDSVTAQDARTTSEGQSNLKRLQAMQTSGQPVPNSLNTLTARTTLAGLSRANEAPLQEQFQGGAGVFLKHVFGEAFWENSRPFYQKTPLAQEMLFKQRAPELQSPQVMAEFLRAVQGLKGWSDEAKQGLLDLTKRSYPDSYQKGVDIYAPITAFTGEAQKTTDALTKLGTPLTTLPTQFTNAGNAVQQFSVKLNGIDLRVPGVPAAAAPNGPMMFPLVPSKASGGTVLKGGLVRVHDGEDIVPANVTAQWGNLRAASRQQLVEFRPEVARMIVAEGRGQRAEVGGQRVVHVHPGAVQINLHPGSRAADDPDELARLVARSVEIQLERA